MVRVSWPILNFWAPVISLEPLKLESLGRLYQLLAGRVLGYRMVQFCDPRFSRFDALPAVTDRRTDAPTNRQTHDDNMYRAIIA